MFDINGSDCNYFSFPAAAIFLALEKLCFFFSTSHCFVNCLLGSCKASSFLSKPGTSKFDHYTNTNPNFNSYPNPIPDTDP